MKLFATTLALCSLAAGADGLLIEIHPQPDKAMSDGAQSLDFPGFKKLLELVEFHFDLRSP